MNSLPTIRRGSRGLFYGGNYDQSLTGRISSSLGARDARILERMTNIRAGRPALKIQKPRYKYTLPELRDMILQSNGRAASYQKRLAAQYLRRSWPKGTAITDNDIVTLLNNAGITESKAGPKKRTADDLVQAIINGNNVLTHNQMRKLVGTYLRTEKGYKTYRKNAGLLNADIDAYLADNNFSGRDPIQKVEDPLWFWNISRIRTTGINKEGIDRSIANKAYRDGLVAAMKRYARQWVNKGYALPVHGCY